eukprot:13485037-Alexandrium_andersonii.AAC.1
MSQPKNQGGKAAAVVDVADAAPEGSTLESCEMREAAVEQDVWRALSLDPVARRGGRGASASKPGMVSSVGAR